MLRIVIINLFLFSLPFLLYFIWEKIRKPQQKDTPFFWLLGCGGGLVFLGLIGLAQYDVGGPDGVYVPPRFVDGEIIPGHIDPPSE